MNNVQCKTEPLNYLRQADEFLTEALPEFRESNGEKKAHAIAEFIKKARASKKFILPPHGKIFDNQLRAIPDEIRLPFHEIVIEYQGNGSTKSIILAVENGGSIYFEMCGGRDGGWGFVPVSGSLSGVQRKDAGSPVEAFIVKPHSFWDYDEMPHVDDTVLNDLSEGAHVICELIEALSCSNVTHEALPVRKQNRSAGKRGALPFDEYRVLVVKPAGGGEGGRIGGASGRSPREHLRRGHIRRLDGGAKKIWINSTVVNAGTDGKIKTVYDVRKAA